MSADLDGIQTGAQGHTPQLPRQFTMMSMLAFAFAVSSSWIASSSLLPTHLIFGGPTAVGWIPFVSGIPCLLIALGLAELASAFPSSGGQYHFVFMTADESYRRPAAFIVAWLAIFAWLFTTCSAAIYPAQLTAQLAQVYHPSYTPERWHIWLIYAAFLTISVTILIVYSRQMAKLEVVFFWSSLLAVIAFTITLLAASDTKQSAKTVFAEWKNSSGWDSGLALMLDLGQGMWLYVCLDSATHISEEIHQPSKYVPRAMILSCVMAIITNMIFSWAIIFSVSSLSAVEAAALPIYEVMKQTIGSEGAVLFLMIWLDFVFISCLPGALLTSGRLVWAFSRDNGMPWSPFFSHVHPKYQVPVEASLICWVFCVLFGLIYVGSVVAYNTFISAAALFCFLSYSIPQGIAVISGRDRVLPERHFRLGTVFGSFVNIFSVLWIALYTVLFCFPLTLPTDVQSMNYLSVVLAGGILFVGILWFVAGKRKTFNGPTIEQEVIHAVNPAASDGGAEEYKAYANVITEREREIESEKKSRATV